MEIKLKYVGPKPLFSVSGISFDHSKEDKFVYISIVCELIFAIDHEYQTDTKYTMDTGQKPLDQAIILQLFRQKLADFDLYVEKWAVKTGKEIDEDIERAKHNRLLSDIEKQTLINNIEILRSYRIQRTINKSVYYAGINILGSLIQKGNLEYIITPMFPKFLHVLHSIQGILRKLHPPIDSDLEIYEEQGHLQNRLTIKRS